MKLVESMDGHRMLAAAIELSREEGVQQVTWTQMSTQSARQECEMLVKRGEAAAYEALACHLLGDFGLIDWWGGGGGGMSVKCVCWRRITGITVGGE